LHLGNLRTALLAWLFARSAGAPFLLRIEDLDADRSGREHETAQLEDLRAIGLDWDAEPLRQSNERRRYEDAWRRLSEAGLLYPCWCTRAEIRDAASAPHGTGVDGAYPGTCRGLSAAERRSRELGSRPPAWRLNAQGQVMTVLDRLHGEYTSVVDDFVVWRGDPGDARQSTPAYNLAVVVDDGEQEVGEVVRGDDLLATTPRQAYLASLLGLPVPRYAHVPLVLGKDGRRLAKRHGAVTLADQRDAGVEIPAVVGWLASSAGLAAAGVRLRPPDLIAGFDPARLGRRPTTFGEAG